MACYYPMPAVRLDSGDISMNSRDRDRGSPLQLPCGGCSGCRRDRVASWALRCQHESQTWTSSLVATLTYDEEHLPPLGQLEPKHLQLFIKKLRRNFDGFDPLADGSTPIRFFAVGEYGDKSSRPHYHALLFNLSPEDIKPYGSRYLQSPKIAKLWEHGSVILDRISPESCAYVAGYALKKIRQIDRREPRELIDPATGEVAYYVPPFMRCSNRPGIGAHWYHRYSRDLLRGHVQHQGKKLPIPRYYADRLKQQYPEEMYDLATDRQERNFIAMYTDPTYDYRRSREGRDAAEHINAARKSLLSTSKSL